MEKGLTLDKALQNIEIVITQSFSGTRNEHIALDQSLRLIKETLTTCKSCPTSKCDEDEKECIKQESSPEGGC